MPTDAERIDFLETLRNRAIFPNKKNPAYYKRTDIHISGPAHCTIYARTEIGSGIEFSGHGDSVRDAIDMAMGKAGKSQNQLNGLTPNAALSGWPGKEPKETEK